MSDGKGPKARVHEPEVLDPVAELEIREALPALKAPNSGRRTRPVDKSVTGFTRSTATWLSLFTAANAGKGPEDARTHTIRLADAIPLFHYGHQPSPGTKALERTFVNERREYHLTVLPATLEDGQEGDGDRKKKWAPRFPGEREELVFEAVKAIASQNAELLDGHLGVGFTLSAVRRLSKESGHEMSISQIKQALRTLQRCTIILRDASGKNVIEEGALKSLMFSEKGTRDLCFVQFNSFTTEAIKAGQYRGLRYKVLSSFQSPFARWLYKTLAQNFTQASATNTYDFLASSALRNAGLFLSKTPNRDGIFLSEKPCKWASFVKHGLDEMKAGKPLALPAIVSNYVFEPVKRGRYVKDYKFFVTATPEFVSDVIAENARMRRVEFQLRAGV